jgi:hypothetical protein
VILIVIAVIGLIAAERVSTVLEKERSFYQAVLRKIFSANIPDIGFRRKRPIRGTRFFGWLPSIAVPIAFLVVWLAVILSHQDYRPPWLRGIIGARTSHYVGDNLNL